MQAGGAARPMNFSQPIAEFRRQLDLLRPDRAILGPGFDPAAEDLLRSLGVAIWRACWKPEHPAGAFDLCIDAPQAQPAPRESLPPETRLLMVSSGTTSLPKMIPLSVQNLSAMFANSRRCFQLTPEGRYLGLAPLFHLHGIANALAQLAAGGSVICPDAFDPVLFPAWLREYRPTWYAAGPAVHRAVASLAASGTGLYAESLRFVRSSSARLDPGVQESVEAALGVPVIDSYGLSETGTIASNPLPPLPRKPGSAGVSVGPEMAILDIHRRPLPSGEEGEIAVRGANVFAGYWGDSAANREIFSEGWLCTGDLGRLDQDGYLFITGRSKDVINRGGMKLLPAEIESVLLEHPGVLQAAVFSVEHASLGEDLEVAVVAETGVKLQEQQLRDFAAQRLAAFKVPRRIHFTGAIPSTATGKPLRGELRRQFLGVRVNGPAAAPALTEKESRIAAIWSSVLKRDGIGPHDDLFALGGDSLAAALILSRVQTEFAITEPLAGFLDRPTVEHLAQIVSESAPEAPPAALHLSGEGPRTPVFCIPAACGDALYLRHLGARLPQRPFFALANCVTSDPSATIEEMARAAVADMRATQPEGPYILAGHCLGGVIAFEAARRLREEGQTVHLVLLLDSPTPGYPKALRRWKRYAPAAWELARSGGPHTLLRETSRHLQMLAGKRKRAGQGQGSVLHGYSPVPLDVPVLQVLSTAHQSSTRVLEDERLGWRDFARAGFRVVHAAGNHDSFLLPPHVDDAARGVQAVLDERRH